MKKPELLLPAGSRSALEAAIEGGADAVYMGANQFNARMRAENFDDEALKDSIRLARAYGTKTYITLNTRLFDHELNDAVKLASNLYEWGADAFIVADIGLASLIKMHIPDAEIHASTQLSGHSVDCANTLRDAGFSRMVCHREITKEGLFHLCKTSPIEIEMFIHGAYCVSFSGQCLMSAVMGGRSGNRGECAQPCRQRYTKAGESKIDYPISLKDMCLAEHITDIIKSGVASLKIEGRQKPAEYVFGTSRIYRRLLDEGRNATPDEIQELDRLFSRDGFSDGYFTKDHRNMRGVRTYDDFLKMDKSKFGGLTKKVPLDVTLTAKEGEAPVFAAKTDSLSASVIGLPLEKSDKIAPLSYEGALKNSSRLGSTPFALRNFEFITDGSAPLTLSALNDLRRRVVDKLLAVPERYSSYTVVSMKKGDKKTTEKPLFCAEFLSEEQITPLAEEFFDRIYLPYGKHTERYGISLPPYIPDEKSEAVWKEVAGRNVLAHTTGQLSKAAKVCSRAAASLRMNVCNSAAAAYCAEKGAEYIILSPDVSQISMRDMSSPVPLGAVAYGRLPLMLMLRCAIGDGKCKKKDRTGICTCGISDRHNVYFPIYGMPDCTNVIYNSVPTYTADKQDEADRLNLSVRHFIFTDESPEECDRMIQAYMDKRPPDDPSKIRRMK